MMPCLPTVRAAFFTTVVAATLLAPVCVIAASAPRTDDGLAVMCLRQYVRPLDSESVAVSIMDGDTTWGACDTTAPDKRYETWWRKPRRGKVAEWRVIGRKLHIGATPQEVERQHYGVPSALIPQLVVALRKAH